MRRILDIIEGVTARCARPDLVLATISSMVAAIIVLALKITLGSSPPYGWRDVSLTACSVRPARIYSATPA